jgi:hypothetical protein
MAKRTSGTEGRGKNCEEDRTKEFCNKESCKEEHRNEDSCESKLEVTHCGGP